MTQATGHNELGDSDRPSSATFGWKTLTLLGASFTAAGCYGPWGLSLAIAGWPGALASLALVAIFYFCLLQCLAEMSAAIPSAGAGQAFAHEAFGPTAGFIAGAAALVQWITGAAALAVLLGIYADQMFGGGPATTIVIAFAVLTVILLIEVGEGFALTLGISLLALVGVSIFIVTSAMNLQPDSFAALRAPVASGAQIWMTLPFAVTFFIGLEGVPFAAEQTRDPGRNLPRGLLASFLIVATFSAATLLLGPAGAGLGFLTGSDSPILLGLSSPTMRAGDWLIFAVNAAAVLALAVSLFGAIYACSRQAYAMGREGELPHFLSKMNRRGAPHWALIVPSLIGVVIALMAPIEKVIVIFVFSSCISYIMMLSSFIGLRVRRSDLARPYRVPMGMVVCGVGIAVALLIVTSCVASDPFWSLMGGATFVTLLAYRLVTSLQSRRGSAKA